MLILLLVSAVSAATMTFDSRTHVSFNNGPYRVSVFDGAAAYDNSGTSDPLVTVPFGDGTVVDYNFVYHDHTATPRTIVTYASGSGGTRISNPTCPVPNISVNGGHNWPQVWTTTDPVGFTTTKDFSNGSVPTAQAMCANAGGTIDISDMADGTIYVPHGTFRNSWTLTMTMSGPGQTNLVAVDTEPTDPVGQNNGWVSQFSFDNTGALYDTITFSYVNTDADGSRARFAGVVLDGTVIPPLAPSE